MSDKKSIGMRGRFIRVFDTFGKEKPNESFWQFSIGDMFIAKFTVTDCQKQFSYLVYDDIATKEFGWLMIKKLKHMKAFW